MYHDPREKNKYLISLVISDFDCSPEKITEELGLKPTEIHIKGEFSTLGKVKIPCKTNSWALELGESKNLSIEEQIQLLLQKFQPNWRDLKSLAHKYTVQINCGVYYYEANPGIVLDTKLLKELSELTISIHFDMYCLSHSQFDYPDSQKNLEQQFSKLSFINDYTTDDHNEAKALAESLIQIDTIQQDLEISKEDLVIWEDLTEEEYRTKFDRLIIDLQRMRASVRDSRYLTAQVIDGGWELIIKTKEQLLFSVSNIASTLKQTNVSPPSLLVPLGKYCKEFGLTINELSEHLNKYNKCIDQWLLYSYDKRGGPPYFFSKDKGMYVVGLFDVNKNPSREIIASNTLPGKPCANFIVKEFELPII